MQPLVNVKRSRIVLQPDQSRVLLRPFNPGDSGRIDRIIERILSIPDSQVESLLDELTREFSVRHRQLHRSFQQRFEQVWGNRNSNGKLTEQKRLLIGACFLAEYSLESAALFNPSIVPHLDQTGLPAGSLRFVLSLRATGEGHISSITFRSGIVHANSEIEIDAPEGFFDGAPTDSKFDI